MPLDKDELPPLRNGAEVPMHATVVHQMVDHLVRGSGSKSFTVYQSFTQVRRHVLAKERCMSIIGHPYTPLAQGPAKSTNVRFQVFNNLFMIDRYGFCLSLES